MNLVQLATHLRSRYFEKHIQRLQRLGLLKSIAYYAFGVAADKLGIKYLIAFEYNARAHHPQRSTSELFQVTASAREWSEGDLRQLRQMYSESQFALFEKLFARGDRCLVARTSHGEIAFVGWVQKATEYVVGQSEPGYLVHSCYTTPEHRGKGLYAGALAFACRHLRSSDCRSRIFVECSAFNYASRNGIINANFVPIGRIFHVRRLTWRMSDTTDRKAIGLV